MHRSATLITLALLSLWAALMAQSGTTVWDGVYSEAQAARGAEAYQANCASCHGGALEGIESAPPLAGDVFNANWTGTTLGDLAERIRVSMPLDRPGSLSRSQVADVIAHMLKTGRFPAGGGELDPQDSSLARVRFVGVKP
jgi:mono/diheme cytochrome c family protein